MSNMRLGPWDLKRELWDQMHAIKEREGKTWRYMLTEGCRLFIASRGMVPHAPVESAPPVAAVAQVAAAGLAAAGLPAAGLPAAVPVELSENEKRLERLIRGKAQKQALLEEAPRELAREPGSLRALNWLARMPGILASYDVDIAACRAAIEAERALSIKKVDNGEEGGEV